MVGGLWPVLLRMGERGIGTGGAPCDVTTLGLWSAETNPCGGIHPGRSSAQWMWPLVSAVKGLSLYLWESWSESKLDICSLTSQLLQYHPALTPSVSAGKSRPRKGLAFLTTVASL